ncbi:unnamed protein product, partial [Tenebrio molitor]
RYLESITKVLEMFIMLMWQVKRTNFEFYRLDSLIKNVVRKWGCLKKLATSGFLIVLKPRCILKADCPRSFHLEDCVATGTPLG